MTGRSAWRCFNAIRSQIPTHQDRQGSRREPKLASQNEAVLHASLCMEDDGQVAELRRIWSIETSKEAANA